ncbi:hypothetical protein SAMN06298215_1698 [Bacteroidales bacterium WCE2008]|nr:hypothetical protein SAMN06298215_1698 [Bacteroidales bacterium WCE2008]
MKNFFLYVFYRVAKIYEDWGEQYVYIRGSVVAFTTIGLIALSIITFVLFFFFDKELNKDIIWGVLIVVAILSFTLKEKKFKELREKYKNETHKKLKGWLVFLYIIGTLFLYIVSLYVCRHP